MRADHRRLPFTISVDKNAAYPEAFTSSQKEKVLPHDCQLRRVKKTSIASSNRIIDSLKREYDHARVIARSIRQRELYKESRL